MKEDFNKEELKLINKLKIVKRGIIPSKTSFEKMLSSLSNDTDNNLVTNKDNYRYTFSMWKYVLAVLVIALIGGFAFLKSGQINPSSQTPQVAQNQEVPNQPVTASNADSALQQTDSAISQTSDQADQELNKLDQTSSSEDDLNNL